MIRLENVCKAFQHGRWAVRDVTFTVNEGETLVLVGTSGSGKTTTMKMINRLIGPTSGRIFMRGEDIAHQDVTTLRRGIGYVIQQIGLFPHMTIGQNVGTVPGLLRWPQARIRERVDEMLDLVGLPPEEFRERYPHELSGGQQQRVGVARALAADPPIILMDEPFGALDPLTREQLQEEFRQLQRRIQKTIVFVTHDVFEAVSLGDRMAVMDAGRLVQIDRPDRLLAHPADDFVARFLGKHRLQLQFSTMNVAHAMTPAPPLFCPSHGRLTCAQARQHAVSHGASALMATGPGGEYIGLLPIELLRASDPESEAETIIRRDVETVRPETELLTATDVLANCDWSAVPVVNEQMQPVGLVQAETLIRLFASQLRSGADDGASRREAHGGR